jgi:hypothetical protein
MNGLQIAYCANVAILVPIAVPTMLRLWRTDQGCFAESSGWRVLVGSLWTAILVLSVLGLRDPVRFAPMLLLQLIYKSLWLAFYALPEARRGNWRSIPVGITAPFAAIVAIWPWLIPWGCLCGR